MDLAPVKNFRAKFLASKSDGGQSP